MRCLRRHCYKMFSIYVIRVARFTPWPVLPRLPLCMYVCLYACMHVCTYACMHVYVCMYVCMHACMCVCMHVYMYVCMYTCMYVCMHVCMYSCMYVCIWFVMCVSLVSCYPGRAHVTRGTGRYMIYVWVRLLCISVTWLSCLSGPVSCDPG